MTDTEILDWLERTNVVVLRRGDWCVLHVGDLQAVQAPTLREAVEKAAQENGDES